MIRNEQQVGTSEARRHPISPHKSPTSAGARGSDSTDHSNSNNAVESWSERGKQNGRKGSRQGPHVHHQREKLAGALIVSVDWNAGAGSFSNQPTNQPPPPPPSCLLPLTFHETQWRKLGKKNPDRCVSFYQIWLLWVWLAMEPDEIFLMSCFTLWRW